MAAHGVRLHAYEMARRASLKQAIRFVNVRAFAQARNAFRSRPKFQTWTAIRVHSVSSSRLKTLGFSLSQFLRFFRPSRTFLNFLRTRSSTWRMDRDATPKFPKSPPKKRRNCDETMARSTVSGTLSARGPLVRKCRCRRFEAAGFFKVGQKRALKGTLSSADVVTTNAQRIAIA